MSTVTRKPRVGRGRVEVEPAKPVQVVRRRRPVMAGLIAGVVAALGLGLIARINMDYGAPWASTHTLNVNVSDADGMAVGSDVRIAGRLVGQVTSTKALGGYSQIGLKIDSSDWPLPSDTEASVRLATLLGAKYVQLTPGQSTASLPEGGTVGLAQSKPVVDFDQVLDTFNQPTRTSVTSLIKTLGTPNTGALAGEQGTLQQLIPDVSQLSQASVVSTGELATRNPQLNGILINLGTTSQMLAQSSQDLAGNIDALNSITGALATHTASLSGFIRNTDAINQTANQVLGGPGAGQLNAGLSQLGGLSTNLNTLLAELTPETSTFIHTSLQASINLVYEIGDATSQSDRSGYFLRQNTAGIDISGLLPVNSGVPLAAPSLTGPQLPALPSLPSLPPLCTLQLMCPNSSPAPGSTPSPAPSTAPCNSLLCNLRLDYQTSPSDTDGEHDRMGGPR